MIKCDLAVMFLYFSSKQKTKHITVIVAMLPNHANPSSHLLCRSSAPLVDGEQQRKTKTANSLLFPPSCIRGVLCLPLPFLHVLLRGLRPSQDSGAIKWMLPTNPLQVRIKWGWIQAVWNNISVNISVGKCWSCYCFVCICVYLTLGIFIVSVYCCLCCQQKDSHPVLFCPDPCNHATELPV